MSPTLLYVLESVGNALTGIIVGYLIVAVADMGRSEVATEPIRRKE